MQPITTFKDLVYNLNMGPGYDGYVAMISAAEINEPELKELCCWDEDHYQRVRFYDTDSLEGLITCWEKGQEGPIHNYEFQQGWIKVMQGELWLEYFKKGQQKPEPYFSRMIREGEVVYLNDSLGYHRFSNRTRGRAIALHLYAEKLSHWHEMDPESGKVNDRKITCDKEVEFS